MLFFYQNKHTTTTKQTNQTYKTDERELNPGPLAHTADVLLLQHRVNLLEYLL